MSVTLIADPPAYSFSRDQLKLKFQCTDMMDSVGYRSRSAINFLMLPIPAGNEIVFKYGLTTVTMVSALVPDDSGFQFPSASSDIAVLIGYFQGNYVLSNDFDISQNGSLIYFIAKKESFNYDIANYTGPYFNLTRFQDGSLAKEKANYSVLFRLYCEYANNEGFFEHIYESSIPVTYGSTGIAEVSVFDKLNDYISAEVRNNMPDIPTDGFLNCRKSCRKYYFEFAESFGSPMVIKKVQRSKEFTVLHGGLSTLGEATKTLQALLAPSADRTKDRFLKQGPLEVLTRKDQPQYLYFFNTRALTTATLNCRFYFTDGSNALLPLQTFQLAKFQKFGYNVRFDKIFVPNDYPTKQVRRYELWLTDSTAAVISERRFYELDNEYRQFYKYFLNWSSWGTMDTRMFYGKGSVELELVQAEADKSNNDVKNIAQGTSIVYDISGQTKFTLTTGFIKDKSLLLFNRDFFFSPFKYLVYGSLLLPIKVTSKNIPEIEDGENLFAQKFDWQYLFEDHAFTEGDVYQAPVVIPPPVGQVYFGSSAIRPVSELQIKAFSSQSPEVYIFPIDTLLNRFFFVAAPPGKAIGNVYSQTTDENLTSEFIYKAFVIDGLNYRLYVMEMAIPFSISNTLIISLNDV